MSYIQNIELGYSYWRALEHSAAYSSDTVYYLKTDLQYVAFFVDTLNNYVFYTNINRDPSSKNQLFSGAAATAVIQDITYTSTSIGTSGNSVTIQYTNDAPKVGQESVTVTGNAIVVHIVSGKSTAQQVVTAVNAWSAYSGLSHYNSSASTELVSAVVSGNSGNPQTTQGPTSLTGGTVSTTILSDFTTTYLGTAMLVPSFLDGYADDLTM